MLADSYEPARNIFELYQSDKSTGMPKSILFKRYSLWLTFARSAKQLFEQRKRHAEEYTIQTV